MILPSDGPPLFVNNQARNGKPGSRRNCIYRLDLSDLSPLTSPVSTRPRRKVAEMPRDLFEATMQSWARLTPAQRERFFQAGLRAPIRLHRGLSALRSCDG